VGDKADVRERRKTWTRKDRERLTKYEQEWTAARVKHRSKRLHDERPAIVEAEPSETDPKSVTSKQKKAP
jgi:hypothetical protein